MGKQFDRIEPVHRDFIARQRIFFAGSAAEGSKVNISPKDGASLQVLDAQQVVYLDQTGSGNETAAHILADGRITIMFCAFEGAPMILRLYGRGRVLARGSDEYAGLLATAFDSTEPPGARQMILLHVDLVQTSCGFGVPCFDHKAERETLRKWAANKGEEGVAAYQREKNARSIDGLPSSFYQET